MTNLAINYVIFLVSLVLLNAVLCYCSFSTLHLSDIIPVVLEKHYLFSMVVLSGCTIRLYCMIVPYGSTVPSYSTVVLSGCTIWLYYTVVLSGCTVRFYPTVVCTHQGSFGSAHLEIQVITIWVLQ